MSRRIVAPVALLVAAAFAVAAVFAVQGIEDAGGPLAQPFVTPAFSPDGDGSRDEAVVRFTTQQPESVTVLILDAHGNVVRTLMEGKRIDGMEIKQWNGRDDDGRLVADGVYHVRITRAGDARRYAPVNGVVIDTVPPVTRLDSVTYVDGELRGLVQLEPGAGLTVLDGAGEKLGDLRAWPPKPGTVSGRVTGRRLPGTDVIRFAVPVDVEATPLDELQLVAADRAGNRVDLLAASGAPRIRTAAAP